MTICALVVWTWLNQLWDSLTPSSSDTPDTAPAETATVSFEVVDELANRTYHEADQVIARQGNSGQAGIGAGSGAVGSRGGRNAGYNAGRNTERNAGGDLSVKTGNKVAISLNSGEGSAELNYGDWTFEIKEKNQTVGQREQSIEYGYYSDHIVLSVDPYTVDVKVTNGPNREPVPQAEITATAEVEDWSVQKQTDSDGTAQIDIPRSASTVSLTSDKEGLLSVESDWKAKLEGEEEVILVVGAETGRMAVETKVGERELSKADIRITPISRSDEFGTIDMNATGSSELENLPTGEYEVSAQPQLGEVETTAATERVTVRADETADVTIDVGITYSVSAVRRERISDLRDRIEQVTTAPDRDMAIPRYYGTVLTSMLDLIEEIESAPERTVKKELAPDAVVEAVLAATDAGLTALKAAMSDRRTIQVCKAAESMPETEVRWDGEVALDAFLDRLSEGGDHERSALRDRLNEVNDLLKQRWNEVAEVAPARKLHTQLEELAQDVDTVDDELTVVAHVFVGICLLDAIEELFEHDALRDRLNSITY